ncbi:hypothetical protein EMIHUDRAFT_457317, partial [Emiliania huxleyi CCMP1516]|uniref:Uncharacterized protein n=2 Tax=Emiliania huxleyi TaxID=2903 RepID=A0A0D3JTB5_EMIH1
GAAVQQGVHPRNRHARHLRLSLHSLDVEPRPLPPCAPSSPPGRPPLTVHRCDCRLRHGALGRRGYSVHRRRGAALQEPTGDAVPRSDRPAAADLLAALSEAGEGGGNLSDDSAGAKAEARRVERATPLPRGPREVEGAPPLAEESGSVGAARVGLRDRHRHIADGGGGRRVPRPGHVPGLLRAAHADADAVHGHLSRVHLYLRRHRRGDALLADAAARAEERRDCSGAEKRCCGGSGNRSSSGGSSSTTASDGLSAPPCRGHTAGAAARRARG